MRTLLFLATILITCPDIALAQHRHNHAEVKETGHASFAAIAEIVSALEANPKTDWSKVDVGALRDHLVDMDLVTMRSSVTSKPIENGMQFTVTGEGEVIGAIHRMASNHASVLQSETEWTMTSEPNSNGAVVNVITIPDGDISKIKALGFYGILTIGAHHQAHHLLIASGEHPH